MSPHSTASMDELSGWFAGRIPADWFAGTPEVLSDRDEILVVGTLSDPELPSDATAEVAASARLARIDGFREDTREHRMRIAQEAQHRFGRRAFAQPRARVVRAPGRAEAGRVAEGPARGALGRREGAGRGPHLVAGATPRRAPSDTAVSR